MINFEYLLVPRYPLCHIPDALSIISIFHGHEEACAEVWYFGIFISPIFEKNTFVCKFFCWFWTGKSDIGHLNPKCQKRRFMYQNFLEFHLAVFFIDSLWQNFVVCLVNYQISFHIFWATVQHSRRRVQRFSFRSSFFLLLSKWLDGGCVKITSTNNPLFLDQI